MPNAFLTIQNIARQTMIRLTDNIVMPQLCYRDFNDTFTDMGETIRVRKPSKLEAKEYERGTEVETQDIKEDCAFVTLDKVASVDVKWDVVEGAVNMSEQKLVADVIEPSAAALAEKINKDGLAVYRKIPNVLGTPGTTPASIADLAKIRTQLNVQKAPTSNRHAIWDPIADGELSQIDNLRRVNEAGTNAALREGEIGRLYGLDNYMSQGVAVHQKGTLAATGSNAKIMLSGAATDATEITLDTDGTALAGTLLAGDRLTIGKVVATVAEDATAKSNKITVKLVSPITAADDATVTVGGNYTANMAFHKNAIAFVNRPLPLPDGGAVGYVTVNPLNQLSLRVVRGYDMRTKTNMMSIDILYGYELIYPELALVYMG